MTTQQSPRVEQLLGVAQVGMVSLIKEPVRDAVREALTEERLLAEDAVEDTRRSNDETRTESGNSFLRPAMMLPILGLAAVGALMKRRSLMSLADETGVMDQSDGPSSDRNSNQAGTGSTSTDADDSTSHQTYSEATEHAGSTEHNVDTNSNEGAATE